MQFIYVKRVIFNLFGNMTLCKEVIDEIKFNNATKQICAYFNVPMLHRDQIKAFEAFLCERNVYFSAHTGYGKRLVFQALPLLVDEMLEQAVCTSTVLVLSPLTALMQGEISK